MLYLLRLLLPLTVFLLAKASKGSTSCSQCRKKSVADFRDIFNEEMIKYSEGKLGVHHSIDKGMHVVALTDLDL